MFRKKQWKRNLRKLPSNILSKVQSFNKNDCVVSCVSKIRLEDIEQGIFAHLGIHFEGGKVIYPEHIIPSAVAGTYSKRNRFGYRIVYKNKPKISKTYSVEVPNYGDWSKGSHEVEWTRQIYEKEHIAPKLVPITIKLVGEDVKEQAYVFTFTVHETLDRTDRDFQEQLLFNLNILQENTGNHDVFESGSKRDDYLKTLYVNWEILPPGKRHDTIDKILSGVNSSDPKVRARLIERYDFLRSFKPRNFIRGVSGFQNYFGAQFADDFVVFENVEYGNAAYVMFDDWKELSKKSRIELLSSHTQKFERIRHTKSWKAKLRRIIKDELHNRN